MSATALLVAENRSLLQQARELLERLDNATYARNGGPEDRFDSGIGRHLRHVLEMYRCLLSADESVDYTARPREIRLEQDRAAALAAIAEIDAELAGIGQDRMLQAWSGDAPGAEGHEFSRSSVNRELRHLCEHTVHHYALISLLLRQMDLPVEPDFGVASSTRRHQASGEQQAN